MLKHSPSRNSLAQRTDRGIQLPGLATAHSHAFQRAIRGVAQRHAPDAGTSNGDLPSSTPGSKAGSFWSWRDSMYRVASRLTPESIYDISRYAYAELARNGVCAVGEFHYLHHQADGTPYDDRIAMAEAVIHAARDVGLRICLLRVLYHRAGFERPAQGAQRRFSDANLSLALGDVGELMKRWQDDEAVSIGLAPHSVRAVPSQWIAEAAQFAKQAQLPLHMHVAEQPREIEECLEEYGQRPIQLVHECGATEPNFVAIHATHLADDEFALLRGKIACICRTTERDLGDGLPNIGALRRADVRLCAGVDSHALSDPFEELRAIELDERTRTLQRHTAADGTELLEGGSTVGYAALGLASDGDHVLIAADDWSLTPHQLNLDDVVVFASCGRAVSNVNVMGKSIVEDGRVPHSRLIRERFAKACVELLG